MTQEASTQSLGVDVSLLPALEAAGARYADAHGTRDPLLILRDAGFTIARLRLFHSPSGLGAQVNDLAYTVRLAQRCVQAGFKILLCPHLSDTWADPGRQNTPRAWAGLPFDSLRSEVRAHMRAVVRTMNDAGCGPSVIQIGNEITGGFLWDAGRVSNADADTSDEWLDVLAEDEQRWDAFTSLLRSAIAGVDDAAGGPAGGPLGSDAGPEIMLHIDRGGDERAADCFFGWMDRCDVRYDQVGLSYYPFWHGSLDDLCRTVVGLHREHGRPVHVVETAFPAEPHPVYTARDASAAASLGVPPSGSVGYPISPDGQRAFVTDLLAAMRRHDADGWEGLSYWAPEWIRVPGRVDEPDAETCWPRALFDHRGEARPALKVFGRFARSSRPELCFAPGHVEDRVGVRG